MIKLYAKAAIYKPNNKSQHSATDAHSALPIMPTTVLNKTVHISSSHCNKYNKLTHWQHNLAALIHPNYVQTLSLPLQLSMMVMQPFPFKPMGLVHVANAINIHRLPEQTATLHISTSFGKVYYHRRGWLFEVITQASQDEKVVNNKGFCIEATSYYLARTRHNNATQEFYKTNTQTMPSWLDSASSEWVSGSDTIAQLDFSDDIGRRYAKVSGDYNPIHLYPYTAKLLGFKKAIAHGMYSKAWAVSNLAQQHSFASQPTLITTTFMQPISLPLSTQLSVSKSANEIDFSLHSQHRGKARVHLVGNIHIPT
ncbi:MAG: MaoC/PaaZ C-terminal domain-containing protein [Glaciecola sp.]